jgi:hypothetical protein
MRHSTEGHTTGASVPQPWVIVEVASDTSRVVIGARFSRSDGVGASLFSVAIGVVWAVEGADEGWVVSVGEETVEGGLSIAGPDAEGTVDDLPARGSTRRACGRGAGTGEEGR